MIELVSLVSISATSLLMGLLVFLATLSTSYGKHIKAIKSLAEIKLSFKKSVPAEEIAKETRAPPGPKPWPVIGSLHLLGKRETPFESFLDLAKVYGDIFSITLGTTPCVVVNNFPLIKEVLITKGPHFGGRPNFIRYHMLFGGDRDNSLALCDWSELQKARRSLARHYCHPRASSMQFDTLSSVLASESGHMIDELHKISNQKVDIKPVILAMCCNVFTHYMCSSRFEYDDPAFQKTVRNFDQIFWDINQGYAVDFLPWLLPAYRGHMQQLSNWGRDIRQFIITHIIEEHRQTLDKSNLRDFTDALLAHLEDEAKEGSVSLNYENALYELEDFLGGHSAIGNLLMRAIGELCSYPEVVQKIQEEISRVTGDSRPVTLEDRPSMPYTEAAVFETLRLSSSPIVPHVAMQDTSVAGYEVKEGTMVFLNNYHLNVSPDHWDQPHKFDPSRFVKNGKIFKPEYFIPFSTGNRACMGYRLVQHISFVTLATLLQNFNISAPEPQSVVLPKACIAVAPDAFPVTLSPRFA